MSAVCQRRKNNACAVFGTTWTGAEKVELQGDARVRVEAGDLFVGVFLQCGPSGRGTGAKEGDSDGWKWIDRAQRPTRLRARDRGVKDSEEQSGFWTREKEEETTQDTGWHDPGLRGREGQALDGNTGAGLESGLVCRRCAVPGRVWARLGCWRQ